MKHARTTARPLRVGLISLGCAKNLVDAEIMLGSLLKHGVEITNDATNADALIVNTCSFIDAAQEESVDAILESAQLREAQNHGQALIVSGCLPQRFRDELPAVLPEVDAFMGIDQVAQVAEIVQQALQHRAQREEGRISDAVPKVVGCAITPEAQIADSVGKGGHLRHVRQVLHLPTPGRLLLSPNVPNPGGPNADSTGDTDRPAPEQPGRSK